jgi:hypothetical protein
VSDSSWPKAPVQENGANGGKGQQAGLYSKRLIVCFFLSSHSL